MGSLDSNQVQMWIQAARAGDEDALRALIGAAMEYLFPATLSMLGERHSQGSYLSDTLHSSGSDLSERMRDDAWAITHAACVRMAGKLHTFRGKSALGRSVQFSTWVYAIARNEMRNLLRGRWREAKRRWRSRSSAHDDTTSISPTDILEREPADASSQEDDMSTPERAVMQQAERQLINEALAKAPLTPEQREAIRLYYGLGYKQERIAEMTGVQIGTVKKRLYDGLRKLRAYVQDRTDEPTKREGSV